MNKGKKGDEKVMGVSMGRIISIKGKTAKRMTEELKTPYSKSATEEYLTERKELAKKIKPHKPIIFEDK